MHNIKKSLIKQDTFVSDEKKDNSSVGIAVSLFITVLWLYSLYILGGPAGKIANTYSVLTKLMYYVMPGLDAAGYVKTINKHHRKRECASVSLFHRIHYYMEQLQGIEPQQSIHKKARIIVGHSCSIS